MPTIATPVLKDKGMRLGYTHSWWLAHSPVDGEVWSQKERLRGGIYSELHRRSPDGKYREGGPFYTLKYRTTVIPSDSVTVFRKDQYRAYQGRFAPGGWSSMHDFTWMPMYNSTTENVTSDMFVYGAQAMARLRPDRPDFSPLLAVIETLRELPTIWASFKGFNQRYHAELRRLGAKGIFLSKSGKYHLAIQFGIMPLWNDFKAFFKAYEERHKRFEQLWRDNGKWVRRRVRLYTEGPDRSNEGTNGWSSVEPNPWHAVVWPSLKAECYGGGKATAKSVYHSNVDVWAVGKCKYFLPQAAVVHKKGMKKLKRQIYSDLTVTPDVLYNLIPWSWFVDYFTTLGGLFEAASGGLGDSIIFDYAYIMRRRSFVDVVSFTSYVYLTKTSTGPVTCTVVRDGDLKGRIEASLFGFGLTEESLSPFQWGILGALGLSKL